MMFAPFLLVALALAPRPEAEAGVEAFAEGRYADAAEILERAYEHDPTPDLLFAWAQAERYAGHCPVAVPLFREILASEPPADVGALAREAIAACGEDPERAPEPEPEPEPEAEPEPEPEPEPLPEPRRRSSAAARDPLGHALLWPGVALGGVGAGLLGEAHRRRAEGEAATNERAYREALQGAPTLSRVGIAVLAGGGALIVAGVVRLAMMAARGRDEPTRSRLRPQGAGLVWNFELAPRRGRILR